MVLYEDLRIYTIWRTDMARAKSEESIGEYRKSAEEWEILGELAERLHHIPEAVEAYQSCLRVRFSPKAMTGVLRMYEGQARVNEVLQCVIRLIAWQYRWYSEVIIPSLFGSRDDDTEVPHTVFPSSAPDCTKAHRERRCGQGSQHRASDQSPTAGSRPNPSLC